MNLLHSVQSDKPGNVVDGCEQEERRAHERSSDGHAVPPSEPGDLHEQASEDSGDDSGKIDDYIIAIGCADRQVGVNTLGSEDPVWASRERTRSGKLFGVDKTRKGRTYKGRKPPAMEKEKKRVICTRGRSASAFVLCY